MSPNPTAHPARGVKAIEKAKTSKFGSAKGRFKMSPDFDAPLEDLKEYMG